MIRKRDMNDDMVPLFFTWANITTELINCCRSGSEIRCYNIFMDK